MVGWTHLVLHQVQRRPAMSAGKGDAPRPVNAELYGQNYEDIFRKPNAETRIKLLKLISNYQQTTETNESEIKDNTGKSDK